MLRWASKKINKQDVRDVDSRRTFNRLLKGGVTFPFDQDETALVAFFRDVEKLFTNLTDENWDDKDGGCHDFVTETVAVEEKQLTKDERIFILERFKETLEGPALNLHALHTRPVFSVAFNDDGTKVVSGSADNTIKVWNVATGTLEHTLESHTRRVRSVAFNHDGTKVVSGSYDNTIKVWNVATGEMEQTLNGHTRRVRSVAFNHNSTKVVSGSADETIKVWNVATGEMEHTLNGHTSSVFSVAFNDDGTKVVSGSADNTIKVWNVATGTLEQTLNGHADIVWSVAFNHDGTKVVSGSEDNTIKVWNVAGTTGKLEHTLKGHTDWVMSVAFNDDGTKVVSGSDDATVKVWNVATGTLEHTLNGHTQGVNSVAFNDDGTKVVSGSDDNTVKVWNLVKSQKEIMLNAFFKETPRALTYAKQALIRHAINTQNQWAIRVIMRAKVNVEEVRQRIEGTKDRTDVCIVLNPLSMGKPVICIKKQHMKTQMEEARNQLFEPILKRRNNGDDPNRLEPVMKHPHFLNLTIGDAKFTINNPLAAPLYNEAVSGEVGSPHNVQDTYILVPFVRGKRHYRTVPLWSKQALGQYADHVSATHGQAGDEAFVYELIPVPKKTDNTRSSFVELYRNHQTLGTTLRERQGFRKDFPAGSRTERAMIDLYNRYYNKGRQNLGKRKRQGVQNALEDGTSLRYKAIVLQDRFTMLDLTHPKDYRSPDEDKEYYDYLFKDKNYTKFAVVKIYPGGSNVPFPERVFGCTKLLNEYRAAKEEADDTNEALDTTTWNALLFANGVAVMEPTHTYQTINQILTVPVVFGHSKSPTYIHVNFWKLPNLNKFKNVLTRLAYDNPPTTMDDTFIDELNDLLDSGRNQNIMLRELKELGFRKTLLYVANYAYRQQANEVALARSQNILNTFSPYLRIPIAYGGVNSMLRTTKWSPKFLPTLRSNYQNRINKIMESLGVEGIKDTLTSLVSSNNFVPSPVDSILQPKLLRMFWGKDDGKKCLCRHKFHNINFSHVEGGTTLVNNLSPVWHNDSNSIMWRPNLKLYDITWHLSHPYDIKKLSNQLVVPGVNLGTGLAYTQDEMDEWGRKTNDFVNATNFLEASQVHQFEHIRDASAKMRLLSITVEDGSTVYLTWEENGLIPDLMYYPKSTHLDITPFQKPSPNTVPKARVWLGEYDFSSDKNAVRLSEVTHLKFLPNPALLLLWPKDFATVEGAKAFMGVKRNARRTTYSEENDFAKKHLNFQKREGYFQESIGHWDPILEVVNDSPPAEGWISFVGRVISQTDFIAPDRASKYYDLNENETDIDQPVVLL